MRTVIVILGLLLSSVPARANTIYTYLGTPFEDIVDVPFPGGTFDTSMFVSGSFELANALPANLAMTDIGADVLHFSFSDGRDTLTESSPETTSFFFVSTNGAGQLTDWFIAVQQTPADLAAPQPSIWTLNDPQGLALGTASVLDLGQLAMCDPAKIPRGLCEVLADQASTADHPGTWSSTAPPPPVPEPASAGLVAIALLSGWVRARRGRKA